MPVPSHRCILYTFALGLFCANCGSSIVKFKPTDADFSFVAIGDAGEATDIMKNNAAVLKRMYREDKFDALIFVGDNFYPIGLNVPRKEVPKKIAAVLDPFEEVTRGLGRKNIHAIPGNHDYYAFLAVDKKFLFGLFELQFAPYGLNRLGNQRADTISTWTYHHETAQDTVYERHGNKIQLIFFDSAILLRTDTTAWKPMLTRLEQVLATSPQDVRWRFLFVHHPLYMLGPHGGYAKWDEESGGVQYLNPCDKLNAVDYLRNNLDPQDICTEEYKTYSRSIKAAIQRSGKRIDGIVAGHEHSLQLLDYSQKDSACIECPKIHVISGAGSRTNHVKTAPEAAREYLWPVETDDEKDMGKSKYGFVHGLVGELARLAVVDRDDVRLSQDPAQRLALALDPEVHRVERDDPGPLLHLAQHLELEIGVDVGEEHERRAPDLVAELRPELREHVELGVQGLRLVQVVAVLADPAEGPPLRRLEALDVHAAVREEPHVRLGEVLPHGRDEAHLGEEARRVREIRRRAPEDLADLAEGRFDAVECDRADDEEISHGAAPSSGNTCRAGARASCASSARTPSGP